MVSSVRARWTSAQSRALAQPQPRAPPDGLSDLVFSGIIILLLEIVLLIFFFVNLVYVATSNMDDPRNKAGDELYVLMMTTSHFFTNTVSVIELCGRLRKTDGERFVTKKPNGWEYSDFRNSDLGWSAAFFVVPFFSASLDALNMVRCYIYHLEQRVQAQTVLAQINTVASFAWCLVVAQWLASAQSRAVVNLTKEAADAARETASTKAQTDAALTAGVSLLRIQPPPPSGFDDDQDGRPSRSRYAATRV